MNAVETLKLIGRPNAYYPNLAKPLGGVNAAVLFSQLFYWQDKAVSELGVYKTRDELEEETGLTHNEQRTAIKKLSDKGILIVTEKRLDHKTFYKINNEKVNEILADFATSNNQSPRNEESSHPEVDNVEIGETINQSSLDQEITTKTTAEITTDNKKINKKDSFDPVSVKPKNLSIEIWQSWIDYRSAKKHKLQPQTWIAQSKMLEQQTNPEEVINLSIMNGWQGLFPEKANLKSPGKKQGQPFSKQNYGETKQPDWAGV